MRPLVRLVVLAPLALSGCADLFGSAGLFGPGGLFGPTEAPPPASAPAPAAPESDRGYAAPSGWTGSLLDAFLGSRADLDIDPADRPFAEVAFREAARAPVGQRVTWSRPGSGHFGTVTPVADGYDEQRRSCRAFAVTASAGNRHQERRAAACLNADGRWVLEPGANLP